jgi:penicillin-binding protein 1A
VTARRAQRGFLFTALALVLAGVLLLGALLLGIAAVLWYWPRLPPLTKVTDYQPRQHLQVLTEDGVEIAAFGSERRIFVPIGADAAAAAGRRAGDRGHAVLRALRHQPEGPAARHAGQPDGGMPQGASTITQQVARTFFLSRASRPSARSRKRCWRCRSSAAVQGPDPGAVHEPDLPGPACLRLRCRGGCTSASRWQALTLAEAPCWPACRRTRIWANPVVNQPSARAAASGWCWRACVAIGASAPPSSDRPVAEVLVLRGPTQQRCTPNTWPRWRASVVVERFGEQAYTQGLRVHTSCARRPAGGARRAAPRRAGHERKQPWRGPEDHERPGGRAAGTGRVPPRRR